MSGTRAGVIGAGGTGVPWYLGRYFILSTTLMLVVLGYPLARTIQTDFLRNTILNAMLLGALYAVSDRKWVFRTLGILLVPIVAANFFAGDPSGLLGGVAAIATVLFLIVSLVATLAHVVTSRHVTADMVFGSVAVYLLAGVVVALFLLYLNHLNPGSVVQSVTTAEAPGGGSDHYSELLYFSFVTLTSVGYGDLAPISAPARSVALFIGIFGQLYTAILVAKVVGLYTAQLFRPAAD